MNEEKLARASEENRQEKNVRLASYSAGEVPRQTLPVSVPVLEPASDITLVASRGIRVSTVQKRSIFEKTPPRVGMRTMFAIDFYNTNTKEPVSLSIYAEVVIGRNAQRVEMLENTGRIGHYTGSFIPGEYGEWECRMVHVNGEMIDSTKFYVLE